MRTLKSISIFLFAFALVVIFFEFFLSLCGILQPIVRIDPEHGERYRPDITCSSLFVSEGFGLAKTSSEGWFGHEFNDEGTDDISVAVIGNSYVASRQVFYRNNFLALSEKWTNQVLAYKQIPKTVALFNFGKEDLPLNELLYVKKDIEETKHPDHFLILLNEGTLGVLKNSRYVARYEYENGEFVLDTSFKQASFVKNYQTFEFFTKSAVLFLMYRVKGHLPRIWSILFDKFYIASNEPEEETDEDGEEIHHPTTHLTETDIAYIKELSKDKRVIFMTDLNHTLTDEVKSIIGSSLLINIEPVLQDLKKSGVDPNYWEIPDKIGHYNLVGHRVIANEITKTMIRLAIQDK